ncbi:MAG: hypothetical protein J6R88_03295 [Clostridia bacterium]|nr:hypothetical protein [Clostridia bacterium]
MARLKVTVHPLFFIFGLYFALTGKVFSFLTFTISAGLHEYGHYLASEKAGYKLNRITLMPYGAVISGDLTSLSYKDECKIALAGPLTNAIIALFCIALWWFIPDVYPYTELIVLANVSIAIINLLPAYPLDGGRFLYATLCLILKRKTARIIVKGLGVLLSVLLFALFVYSCFTTINITILFFALFILFGVFSQSKSNRYVKIYSDFSLNLTKPKLVKRIAVSGDSIIKDLYCILNGEYYYEIIVFCGNKKTAVLSGEKLLNVVTYSNAYMKIKDAVNCS